MKWKKLLSGAGILAVCAAVAKLLGAFYRIPLTNIVGAEGIGLYQMVFPLYTVLLTISSGGLSSAISKVVAAEHARGDHKGARRVLRIALVSLLSISALAAVALIAFRQQIAALQGNVLAAYAYLGIAPAVVFVAVICCFRGYFQGRRNMLPSGISQIIEQFVKLFAGLYFASILLPRGVEFGVLGAVLGVTVSEFIAMLALVFQYSLTMLVEKRRSFVYARRINLGLESAADFVASPIYVAKRPSEILRGLYRIAVPITLGSLIMPLTSVIDSVMVINVLTAAGMSSGAATQLFGLFSGPISSLVNMPVAITMSISVALLPKIAYLSEQVAGESAAAENETKPAKTDDFSEHLIKFEAAEDAVIATPSRPKRRRFFIFKRRNKTRTAKTGLVEKEESTGIKIVNTMNSNRVKTSTKPAKNDVLARKSGAPKGTGAAGAAADALKFTLLLSLPAAVFLIVFAPRIVDALYSRGLEPWQMQISSSLLRLSALSVVYIGFIQVATAVLQGADRPHRPAINLLYGAITKVLLTLVLLPILGIRGAAIASCVCYGIIAVIDLRHMRRAVAVRLDIVRGVAVPLLGCAVMVAVVFAGSWGLSLAFSPKIAFFAAAALGALCYGAVLIIFKAINIRELL